MSVMVRDIETKLFKDSDGQTVLCPENMETSCSMEISRSVPRGIPWNFHVFAQVELQWKSFSWKFYGVFHVESYEVSMKNYLLVHMEVQNWDLFLHDRQILFHVNQTKQTKIWTNSKLQLRITAIKIYCWLYSATYIFWAHVDGPKSWSTVIHHEPTQTWTHSTTLLQQQHNICWIRCQSASPLSILTSSPIHRPCYHSTAQ